MKYSLQDSQTISLELVINGMTTSKIIGIARSIEDEEILLSFPDLEKIPPAYAVGKSVMLKFWNQYGLHYAETAIQKVEYHPAISISIATPTTFETKQNRKFFRVTIRLPVQVSIVNSANATFNGKQDDQAFTEDLSAGGIRFITTLPLQVDDKINIVLNIKLADRNVPITTKLNGKVIRVVSLPVKGKPPKVSVGVEFIYASSREQNEMVRLMFALQRQTR